MLRGRGFLSRASPSPAGSATCCPTSASRIRAGAHGAPEEATSVVTHRWKGLNRMDMAFHAPFQVLSPSVRVL